MKKRIVPMLMVVLAVFLTIAVIAVLIVCGIGSSGVSQSFVNLYVKSISLTSEKCFIEIDTWDSGIYFLGYDYFIEDKVLQITVYSEGLCLRRGKPWPVKINIFDDALAEVNRICFKDGQTIKQIYPTSPATYIGAGLVCRRGDLDETKNDKSESSFCMFGFSGNHIFPTERATKQK